MSGTLLWLLAWGTVVGLDLVSVGQFMIARPLVAGTVTGWILGDPVAGGLVGAMLELFALDVLPAGAARYPDYGLGAVAGAALAAGAPRVLGLGLGGAVGLLIAELGGVSIRMVRRANTRDVRRHLAALDAGDASVVHRVHARGIARDAIRALVVTGIGLTLAAVVSRWPPVTVRGAVLVTVLVTGAALGAAAAGIMRLTGREGAFRWFLVGVAGGVVWIAAT